MVDFLGWPFNHFGWIREKRVKIDRGSIPNCPFFTSFSVVLFNWQIASPSCWPTREGLFHPTWLTSLSYRSFWGLAKMNRCANKRQYRTSKNNEKTHFNWLSCPTLQPTFSQRFTNSAFSYISVWLTRHFKSDIRESSGVLFSLSTLNSAHFWTFQVRVLCSGVVAPLKSTLLKRCTNFIETCIEVNLSRNASPDITE